MKKATLLCCLVLAGAVVAGLLVPIQTVNAADPKPTPNWCCDYIFSRYCTLCPAQVQQLSRASQLQPPTLALQEPKSTPTPDACPADRCFRDTRGLCWCKK